jgi:bifunctional DNA-binding transcriptional regulator/antitoxin component of YhaV-PrlF toxin-antitoxin module
MNAMSARVTQGGRLVLPAAVRRSMKITDGEVVMLEMHGKVLQVISLRDRLEAVQAVCSKVLTGGRVVDEFLDERRREAAKELE